MPRLNKQSLLRFDSRKQWRAWLEAHHRDATEAWLVLYKASHRQGRLSLSEAVEEALCFGWIDGKLKPLDEKSYALRFSPRQADSVWSVTNMRRVKRLTEQGLMTEAGLEKVAQARRSKAWQAAFAREQTDIIPRDLERALRRSKGALAGYRRLSASKKKQFLYWIQSAKTLETRRKRIETIVAQAAG